MKRSTGHKGVAGLAVLRGLAVVVLLAICSSSVSSPAAQEGHDRPLDKVKIKLPKSAPKPTEGKEKNKRPGPGRPLGAVDYDALEAIFLHESLKRMDTESHAKLLLSIIEQDPDSLGALLALRRMRLLEKRLMGPEPLYLLLRKLEKTNFKECGRNADYFLTAYLRLARRVENDNHWHGTARRWLGVTRVAVVGPFAEFGPSAHDDVFGPEVRVDFNADYQGVYGAVRFRPLRHFDLLDDELDLYEHQRHPGNGYYLATQLISDQARTINVKVEFSGSGKLWLSGALVIDLDRRPGDTPHIDVDLRLSRGRNLLLLKISDISSVRILLRNAFGGGPVTGVLAEYPGEDTAPQIMSPGPPRFAKAKIRAARKLLNPQYGAGDRKAGLRALALASLYETHRLRYATTEALERALKLLPEEPLVKLEFLRFLDQSPLYSTSQSRRVQMRMLTELVAEDPELVPAHLALAKSYAFDERSRDAVDAFDAALQSNPRSWPVLLELAQHYRSVEWRAEWLGALKRARKIAPHAPEVLRAFAKYHESHRELAAERRVYETLLRLHYGGDANTRSSLISVLQRIGQQAEALKLARALARSMPGNGFAQTRLADVLVAGGKLKQANEIYERVAEWTSRPEEILRPAVMANLAAGQEAEGLRLLRKTLKLAPAEHTLRRLLKRLKGQPEDVWTKYAVPTKYALAQEVDAATFPRADSVLLLDEQVQIMYQDGSSISYVHQIRKILTQAGVDRYGKARPPGELLTARTIKPDGKVLEPVGQPGGNLEFPGVAVGCVLDLAFLIRADGTPWRSLDSDRFYFADQRLAEPFLISRFVLVTPESIPLRVRRYNMEEGEGVVIERILQGAEGANGAQVIRTWDVRKPIHPEREALMPTALEFIPWIEITVEHDWRIKARAVAEYGLERQKITRLLREHANRLVKNLKSDEQKSRAIYNWVNANITTQGDTRNAHQALKAKAGDREELFLTLARAAGIELAFAFADPPTLFRSGRRTEVLPRLDWATQRPEDFNRFYAVVQGDDGSPIYLNLAQRMRPFGVVSARWHGAPAILWEHGEYRMTYLPGGAPDQDRYENKATFTLSADGSAQLEGEVIDVGARSYGLKDSLRTASKDLLWRSLEEQIARQFPGFEVDKCLFPDLGRIGTPLRRGYSGKMPALGTVTEGGLSLPLPIEKAAKELSALVSTDRRRFDLVLDIDWHQRDEIRIKPPEGYGFAMLPKDLLYPTAPFVYSLTFRLEQGDLLVRRRISLGPGRIHAYDYADFTEQVKRIKQAEEVKLNLVRLKDDD